MAQGKRSGHMINRPLTPEQIRNLRLQKASFLREVRRMVFAGEMGHLAGNWPYDRKALRQLRNLYDRLHRPERIAIKVLSLC